MERPKAPITIGIIEAQRLFAPHLTNVLSAAGFSVVSSLESVSLDELGRHEPAVVLIDTDFLDVEPETAIRQLGGVLPSAVICAYSSCIDPGWARSCSHAGAACVISKTVQAAQFVDEIQRAVSDDRA